ncbi:kelch domain-containing protein 7A [Genypterus blacodes]|uniref:kelch domain-containing protein 7A n=1 Tax=Genypterus blacodes TaxID=154954 RepID=UPI003F773D19
MPIAELLGVQFDMQLLLKLSLSVAAVLLVSWAYKFYSSRETKTPQLCVTGREDGQTREQQNTTCQSGESTLPCQNSPQHDSDDGDRQPGPSIDDLTPDNTWEWTAEDHPTRTEKTEGGTISPGECSSMNGEVLIDHQKEVVVATSNNTFRHALNLPPPTSSETAGTAGRRSPCFLQKLEGCVGVGRELRQDLEHQGAYSSFLSKAEIKVEDANLVLGATGGPIVRGKIYDYFVESSSHSVNSNAVLGQYENTSESHPSDFEHHSTNITEPPSTLSPIVVRNMILSQSPPEDCFSSESAELRHTTRPVLLRKGSYLSAAEISLPCKSSAEKSVQPVTSLSTGGKGLLEEEADLETLAGAQFLHFPAKILDSADLEMLTSKLDLGNCMEVLGLAKKFGQVSLQKVALRVMSDNYLQVLRAPSLYGRLMAGEREQIQKQRMRGRKFLVVADMDPQDWSRNTAGHTTQTERGRSSALYYYDDYKDVWHMLCPIPQEVISKACAMCTMDNYLFVAVGCQDRDTEMTPSNRVFCYNPLTSIWKEISPMNEARPHCKLAALDGYVYAIGGECLSSVERYDPRADRWTFVAPLPNDTFAVAHRVTVCNGELFVSGGTLRYTLLRYNPKTNTWKPSLLAGSKDRTAEMVAVGRFLYRFDVNPLLGVSVYRYHTVARLWYECSTKRLYRCPTFQCIAMDDAIYCVSRQFTMRFLADEISPTFMDEDLSVLSAAKGILFPAVLSLPDKKPRQTSV